MEYPAFKDKVVAVESELDVNRDGFSIHDLHAAINKSLDHVNKMNVDYPFDVENMKLSIYSSGDGWTEFNVHFYRTQTVAEQRVIYEKQEAEARRKAEEAARVRERQERAEYERLKKKFEKGD